MSGPVPVMHLVSTLGVGGQEMVILQLVEHLDRSRFAPMVVAIRGGGPLQARIQALGVPVRVVGDEGTGHVAVIRRIADIIRAHDIQIVHTHNPSPHFHGVLATVLAGSSPAVIYTKHGRSTASGWRARLLSRLIVDRTDLVVPVSADTASAACEIDGFRVDRMRVIRNGMAIPALERDPREERAGLRAVHVARLNRIKDQPTLLRAVRRVVDSHPTFHLDVVGDGPASEELRELADRLGLARNVTFHGMRDDVPRFLAQADIFLLSSISEGLSISLLEAMAAGLPVIATDVGGNREVIVPGSTGALVPARDPEALAEAVCELIRSPGRLREFSEASRRRVREHFSIDTTVRAYHEAYVALLAYRRGEHRWRAGQRASRRLARGIIRLYETGIKRRQVFRVMSDLAHSQWWRPEDLEELRLQRLRALLIHAQMTVPYYNALFADRGIDPGSFRTTGDLGRIPPMTRETMRTHHDQLRSTDPRIDRFTKRTGGSTGTPLHFEVDHLGNERRMAAWNRGYGWAGARLGTRQWYLWGVAPSSTASWRNLKMSLYNALYRRTVFSCFDLSHSTVTTALDSLSRARPDVIVAYAGALDLFARLVEEVGRTAFSPQSIIVGAEKLYPHQRARIERVFGAPVFETYGSREFTLMAAECEHHDGMHLTAESHILEILDEEGRPVPNGVEGNIAVTDLTNLGMPFIRYLNGDRGIRHPEPCPCGRGLPRLAKVTGRSLDILSAPDGGFLPGEFFPHIMKEIPSVRRFQVVQEDKATLRIRVVAPNWSSSDEKWLRRELASTAASSFQVRVEQVEEIPLTRSGKTRVVVNAASIGEEGQ